MHPFSFPQKIFTCVILLLSFVFFAFLNKFVVEQNWPSVALIACGYAFSMFSAGLITGYFDSIRKQRIDLGFRYHWITYTMVNLAYLIYGIATNATIFTIAYLLVYLLCWGFGLLIHFLVIRKAIKGYEDSELFE